MVGMDTADTAAAEGPGSGDAAAVGLETDCCCGGSRMAARMGYKCRGGRIVDCDGDDGVGGMVIGGCE